MYMVLYTISIKYPSHNCLPEKSCLHCLRILIMSWLFKDPVAIMKEIMSWLFNDRINSGLTQFDHAQSNSKKWPKGQKDQIAPNDFFSWKTTNKFFMYLSAPFHSEKLLKSSRVKRTCHFWAQNGPFVLSKTFLVQTIIITFIYLLVLFIVQNLKNSYRGSRVMRMCHF